MRVLQNELLGRAKLLLDDGYEKLIADRNNYSTSMEEFHGLVGRTLANNGKLGGGYAKQFAHHVEETAARFIREVREPVRNAYIAMKKKQVGPGLVERSEEAVKRARARVDETAARRSREGLASMGSNIKREHGAILANARKSGLYRSTAELNRARAAAINDVNGRYDALASAVDKHAFEQLSTMDGGDIFGDLSVV